MRINLTREALLKPLQAVMGVVERKQTLPILSNVLIDLKNKKMSITGTDLEIELIGHADVDVEGHDKSFTLPGRKLTDICRALPDFAPVELYQEDEKMILRSGRSRFVLSSLPAEDFPSVQTQSTILSFDITQADLKKLFAKTCFAMAQEDVRYYLNGLLLECDTDNIRAVATDGHRLALSSLKIVTGTAERVSVIIPRKGVLELVRMLSNDDSMAKLVIGSSFVQVKTASFNFTSKIISGRFPDYDRVIPKTKAHSITVNKDLLKQALVRTAILCNEKFKGIRFEFRDNLIRILSNNPEQEAAEEELEVTYQGESFDIGFNVAYIMDIINVIESTDVVMSFSDPSSSVLIEEAKGMGGSVFVVMPMRL